MKHMTEKIKKRGQIAREGSCILVSGAYGTELQARGLMLGESADSWNLLRPADVEEVARSYVAAGAGIIVTNTFQANRVSLARHGLAASVEDVNHAGVALATRAAGSAARVFGSIGPVPGGTAPEQCDAVLQQASALVAAGADALVLETFTDLWEAASATRMVASTGRPVITCLSPVGAFDAPQVVATLVATGASGIGLNCMTPAEMLPMCRALRPATDVSLWVKPSAGIPHIGDGQLSYDMTPETFADGCMELMRAGAQYIGGCCGAGPAHIRALRERLHQGAA